MTASPNFTVNGSACPPEKAVAYGATVTLALLSTSGVSTVAWSIVGSDRPSTAIPAITPGGSPLGATATFTMVSDPGTGLGASLIVSCVVNGGTDAAGQIDPSLTKTALVGVNNTAGLVPFSVGESVERSATHGWTPQLNQTLAAIGTPGAPGAGINPAPALVATSNIALTGIVTVDGVASNTVTGDVLCTKQTTTSENGYWTPNAGGAWTRPSYYNSNATVAALLGTGTGLVLGGVANVGSQWFLKSGLTLLGAKVYQRVVPGVTLYMPPPNGTNDLPAFTALVSELTGVGGTIQFQSGLYKSPTGFQLTSNAGIRIVGVSSSISGVPSTLLAWTGPRAANSACFRILACDSCSIAHCGFVSGVSGPEYGCLIGGNGSVDADFCHVFDCQAYGNAAAAPLTTSATSINVATAANTTVAITLVAATVPYAVGTQLTLCSRGGSGILKGLITASSGTAVSFVPTDAFGTGTHTDWDVLQLMNGFNVGSSELCAIYRSTATLCYDGFRMGGVGGLVEATCATSAPIGPSFRAGDSASYVKLFGNAEFSSTYVWTTALLLDGVVNVEASIGMGDGYNGGIPYVLRNILGGKVYGLNASALFSGSTAISAETCTGLHIRSVYGDCPSGFFVLNKGSNQNCSIDALHVHNGTMNTFSGGFNGFTTWLDAQTGRLNHDQIKVQLIESQYGDVYTPGSMALANGRNDNVSLATGFSVITGPSAAFQLSGIAPPVDGHLCAFVYLGAQNFTLLHANTNSIAGSRLLCPGGQDLVLVPRSGGAIYFECIYSTAAGAWIVNVPAGAQTTPIRVCSTTTDTITAADIGGNVQYTNAAGCAITLNTLPAGFSCLVSQEAAGALTFANGTSTAHTAIAGAAATTAQYMARYLFWSDSTHTRIT